MMAHALHTFEGGHCARCGMPYSADRAHLPCRPDRVVPDPVSSAVVRDEPIEKFRAALESIGDESVIPLDDRKP